MNREAFRLWSLGLVACAVWSSGCSDSTPSGGAAGMGGAGGSSTTTGGGGSGGTEVTYCDPATWMAGKPEPPATLDCSDFDSDANPLNVQCRTPGGVWAIDTDKMGTPADKSP